MSMRQKRRLSIFKMKRRMTISIKITVFSIGYLKSMFLHQKFKCSSKVKHNIDQPQED